ncbi:hypothetical protein MA16_Dca026696 [Dendrobium catenatum]|uniref:Uncharacterized protein n=1 Tax=Dendrobium catenatum TaxID=906689 RepID=A0A2I0WDQ4_9ASPA|nr:hypothetical protein MA16_Dca026696 [Dendrobium catenatum]
MAELSVSKATDRSHYQHNLLFPDLEPVEPPPLSPPQVLKPFRRGPMYSTYSELRDWKIRMKIASMSSSTPFPLPLKRTSFSSSVDRSKTFRKENRKPSPTMALNFDAAMTPPPPLAPKLELRKVGSVSAGRMEAKKGRAGELFPMRRSFSGFNQIKEISKGSVFRVEEEGRGGRGGSKIVVSRKSVTGF